MGRLNAAKVLLDHGADVNQPTDVSNCLHNNSPHCMYVVIVVDKSCAWSNCPSNQDKAYRVVVV